MLLTEIANRTKTDKGTVAGQGHGYTLLYDLLFASRRFEPLAICEIGLCIGGPEVETGAADRTVSDAPSIAMWHEFFPNAHIYGIDISDFSRFETDWFTFLRADCGDAEALHKVASLKTAFDLIIDDGSHAAFHQQRTFLSLWKFLKPGGLYVIEDLQWQPSSYTSSLPAVPLTDVLLAEFVETGRFKSTGAFGSEWDAQAAEVKQVLLFDEDWFYSHRRQFNVRNRIVPAQPTLHDVPLKRRRLLTSFWKRLCGAHPF